MIIINRNLLLISVYIEVYILAYIYNLCSWGNDTHEVLTKMHLLLAVKTIYSIY